MDDINDQDTCCRLEQLEALKVRSREDMKRVDRLLKALWIVDNLKDFNEWYDSRHK
jgi:hypothetical protein